MSEVKVTYAHKAVRVNPNAAIWRLVESCGYQVTPYSGSKVAEIHEPLGEVNYKLAAAIATPLLIGFSFVKSSTYPPLIHWLLIVICSLGWAWILTAASYKVFQANLLDVGDAGFRLVVDKERMILRGVILAKQLQPLLGRPIEVVFEA